MAILEIARIQIRRGKENVDGIPTLSPGEFAWAEDTEHLWIGKSIIEGAKDNNNTRILTENDLTSFIFSSGSTLTNQVYVGHVPSPGVPISNAVSTTAQSKFDLFVSVFDFAATNEPGIDSRAAIQNAIDNLWLNANVGTSVEESVRVALLIPAGVYDLSGPIFLPPYATLKGEGKGKTILNLTVSNSVSPLIQFCGGDSLPPSHNLFYPIPAASQISSASQPKYITVSGMTLKYDITTDKNNSAPLIKADCSINSVISDCEFIGNYNAGLGDSANFNYTGIEIRGGNGSSPARNLLIDNCVFQNMYYGINSNYDVEDTLIKNSTFKNLAKGIVHSDGGVIALGNITGPLRTKVKDNVFIDIEEEGICVCIQTTTSTNHTSAFNSYINVGNNLQGDTNPLTSVIQFKSGSNTSVGDIFSRYDKINETTATVTAPSGWLISGPISISSNAVYVTNIETSAILTKIPFNGIDQTIKIDYNLLKESLGISRKGQLSINTCVLLGIPYADVMDNYNYIGPTDGDVVFNASLNTSTNTITVGYTSADAIGTITYKYSLLQQ